MCWVQFQLYYNLFVHTALTSYPQGPSYRGKQIPQGLLREANIMFIV